MAMRIDPSPCLRKSEASRKSIALDAFAKDKKMRQEGKRTTQMEVFV